MRSWKVGKLLGIRNGEYIHGRLENYVEKNKLADAVLRTRTILADLQQNCIGTQQPFTYLLELEKRKSFL